LRLEEIQNTKTIRERVIIADRDRVRCVFLIAKIAAKDPMAASFSAPVAKMQPGIDCAVVRLAARF
jgi:hypothetical protein